MNRDCPFSSTGIHRFIVHRYFLPKMEWEIYEISSGLIRSANLASRQKSEGTVQLKHMKSFGSSVDDSAQDHQLTIRMRGAYIIGSSPCVERAQGSSSSSIVSYDLRSSILRLAVTFRGSHSLRHTTLWVTR